MQDFDKIWDYGNPDETAQKFLNILDKAAIEDNESYVAQLYTQLARTQSLQHKWVHAHDFLDRAKLLLDSADQVTKVRYLLELGRTHNSSGDKKQAYDLFNQAWELAKEINTDGYAVDAAHMLAIAAETSQGTLDWNLKALAYAEQSSQPEAQKWLGSLYNNIGWTYFDDGKYQTALDMFEKALVEHEKQENINNIRTAKWCIARTQRELGQIEIALKTQLILLDEYQADDSTDEYVYEELAHCYSTTGDTTNAAKYAKLAYDILSKQDWFAESESGRLEALQGMM